MRRTAIVLVLMVMAAALPVVRVVAKDAPAGSAAGPNVWADFDNDGFVDLAVGTPSEDVGTTVNAGAVTVLYGSAAGLSATGSQQFTQDTAGVPDAVEGDDHFGHLLASGDFNNDGRADLAVAVLFEDVGTIVDAGAAETDDGFGEALATGDFNNNGVDDLAVGAPSEDVGAAVNGGSVNVLYGSAAGLSAAGSQQLTQDTAGVPGAAESEDAFGEALATGDFNGNGIDDLGVGAPSEDVGAAMDGGAVNVLPGTAGGLTGSGSQQFTEDTSGVPDTVEADDMWGEALATSAP